MHNNSIFEFRANKTGYLIPFENGIALASVDNPEDEARRWKERNKYYFQMDIPLTIFGIGAGLHLQYLHQETLLPITVVDTRAGLVSWARKIFRQTEIEVIHLGESETVLSHPRLVETIGYTLPMIFEPGAGEMKAFFQQQVQHLLGRSDGAWEKSGLQPTEQRHWRDWAPSVVNPTIEQKILQEVLA